MPPRKQTTVAPAVIAERVTRVLDYLSRAVSAVKDGNGDYLYAKLWDLELAVTGLKDAVRDRKPFDGPAVTTLTAIAARHYQAGRYLFPEDGNALATARRGALEHAANVMRFNPPEGIDAETAAAVTQWLLKQAGKPE